MVYVNLIYYVVQDVKKAHYCNATHQKLHWSTHRLRCISMADQEREEAAKLEDELLNTSLNKQTLAVSCPISISRIECPVKSVDCNHLACFDLSSFLLLSEQENTTVCPICLKIISLDKLYVDAWLYNILKELPDDVETIEVEADGTWKANIEQKDDNHKNDNSSSKKEKEMNLMMMMMMMI